MTKSEEFKFTPSQAKLKEKLEAFLEGPDRIFLISGKPGVGKTTMVRHALKKYIDIDYRNNYPLKSTNVQCAGICFAHQAKNVLGQHIRHVHTFASAFGLKEKFDQDTGRKMFVKQKGVGNQAIGHCNVPVFVHDEVSQYTHGMLDIVLANTPIYSKLIFMGDRGQLPPVDTDNTMALDEDSPVFSLDLPDHCKHELTERVRQTAGNPILDLSDIVREEIFGDKNINRVINAIQKPCIDDNGFGFHHMKYGDLYSFMSQVDEKETSLIAYRNAPINWYNEQVRNYLMDYPSDIIVPGDWLCMLDNYYQESPSGVSFLVHNSEKFTVKNVSKTKAKINIEGKVYKYSAIAVQIDRNRHLIVLDPADKERYEEDLSDLADRCKLREVRWDQFWKLKDFFASWTYGYAVTAYKVQGSTYDEVIVDINDILTCRALTPKRQLQAIYTAITRARKNVYFLKSK